MKMFDFKTNTLRTVALLVGLLIVVTVPLFYLYQGYSGAWGGGNAAATTESAGSLRLGGGNGTSETATAAAPPDGGSAAARNSGAGIYGPDGGSAATPEELRLGGALLEAAGYASAEAPTGDGTTVLGAVDGAAAIPAASRVTDAQSPALSLTERLAARLVLYPVASLTELAARTLLGAPHGLLHGVPHGTAVGAGGACLAGFSASLAGSLSGAGRLISTDDPLRALLAEALKREKKYVYLTVDDGPSLMTRGYLDALNARGVRATFFLIGQNAGKHPRVVRDMYIYGHYIANHSFSHKYENLYASSQSLFAELARWDEAVSAVLGFYYHTPIFRFPGGSTYKLAKRYRDEVAERGFSYFDWNCLNGDAQIGDRSAESLFDYMVSTFKGQNEVILLMHDTDGKQTSVDMLGRAIDFFLEQGYEFRTLDEKP